MMALPIAPGASGGTYIPPEDTFQIHTAIPAVRFITQAAQPPSNLYVTSGDLLQVGVMSITAGETVTVNYRLLRAADGRVVLNSFTVTAPTGFVLSTHTEQLAEGFLLSLSCVAGVATTRGATFARIFTTRGALGGSAPAYMLMADYVTVHSTPGFPNGRIILPGEGPGALIGLAVGAIPAGADWSTAVATNQRVRPQSVQMNLVTSAAAGTRFVEFLINYAGSGSAEFFAAVSQGPSLTRNYLVQRVPQYVPADGIHVAIPLPGELYLTAGGTLGSFTQSLQAGDQWFVSTVVVESWLDNV